MVLPARTAVPQTPDHKPAAYYQAGKGNILSHFAGMATPGGPDENNINMDHAPGDNNSVRLRQRRSSQTLGFNTGLDRAATSLVSSSTSTATSMAPSPVDNNGGDNQSHANVVAVGADDDQDMEDASHSNSNVRGNGKMPRELELSLWKLGRNNASGGASSGRAAKSKTITRNAPNGAVMGREGLRHSAPSAEMAGQSNGHRSVNNQNSAGPPPVETDSMFSMHISPPRHNKSKSKPRRSTVEVDPNSLPIQEVRGDDSRGPGDSAMTREALLGSSLSLQESMAFLSRDIMEEERATKSKSAAERAYLYKNRYMDVYMFAAKLCDHIGELEDALKLRSSSTNVSTDLTGSHADEKRMESLCRQVDELSKELRERETMIASLHNDKEESVRVLNELKMSQVGVEGHDREASSQSKQYIAQLEAEVTRLTHENATTSEQAKQMSAKMSEMQHQLEAAQGENAQIRMSMQQTEQNLESVHTQWLKEKADLLDSMDDSKSKLSGECEKLHRENAQLKKTLQQSNDTEKQLRATVQSCQQNLSEAKQYISHIDHQLQEANNRIAAFGEKEALLVSLQDQLQRTQHDLETANHEINYLRRELSSAHEHVESMKIEFRGRMIQLERRIYQAEIVRRSLHNKVMELKGNIRVFCRVRPVLSHEAVGNGSEEIFSFPDYGGERRQIELIAGPRSHVGYGQTGGRETVKKYPFDFDLVFNGQCNQEDVFLEVSALIQSALDGYNVCIFAYGQTGSGKTYTMQGNADYVAMEPSAHMGIVGRAISHIYATIADLRNSGWDFSVSLEMIEIYNETLRDLLALQGSTDKVDLRLDGDGKPMVTNSCVHAIEDERAAWHLLEKAMGRRATKSTNMNDHSSRSHCVISFRLNGVNSLTGDRRNSVVHPVDLAGSERLSKSGSGNDRELLKETQCINKSLSSLGNVICALAKKSSHVPFRDSKLTHFLSPSLGGDSKTLMICNLSPLKQHRDETLNSLRFAKTVNSCEIAFPSYGSRS